MSDRQLSYIEREQTQEDDDDGNVQREGGLKDLIDPVAMQNEGNESKFGQQEKKTASIGANKTGPDSRQDPNQME